MAARPYTGCGVVLMPHVVPKSVFECPQNQTPAITPRCAMNASGVTDRLVNQAKVCDQTRILARLAASGTGNCLPVTPNPKGAVAASVLERQAATSCQVSGPEALLFPRAGVSESVRIQRVQQAALACNVNPTNPATRFNA